MALYSETVMEGLFMKKRLIIMTALVSIIAILVGCGGNEGEDTRQYIDTIGVVFTNNADDIIAELYVFPIAIDDTPVLEQDMGPDLIKNTGSVRRIGSYGVTIELQYSSYNVMARGRQKDIYVFKGVPLSNVCEAVLTFDRERSTSPILTIYHRNGTTDTVVGDHLVPGDAPNHTHVPLRSTVTVQFNLTNETDKDITFISMREADDPHKGEVELFIEEILEAGESVSISYRLYEEDLEITDWLLYIETADGLSIQFEDAFNPWETEQIDITFDGENLLYTAS